MSTAEKDRVIDEAGFRPNVGIVVTNVEGQVLWGKRVKGKDSWQFPQGGINADEAPEEAMYRELREEVGLLPEHVTLLGVTKAGIGTGCPPNLFERTKRLFASVRSKSGSYFASMRLTMQCASTSIPRPNLKTGNG